MAKKNKPLLQEGTVRRMMKLANMEALGDGFISEKYTPLEEEEIVETRSGDPLEVGTPNVRGSKPGDEAFVNEEDELEAELGATEDELGAEDDFADEEEVELDAVEDEGLEGEITITDEEAQDIIDLAAKLETAVGGEEEELGGEEEFDELPVGIEAGGEEEESMLQEGLYEAALQGLNINLVDDRAVRRQAAMQEVKKRIYERVVNRLINENQSARKRLPKRRRKR
tara:strand:+ start:2716 stop:3396 length:681 start_codon:yes stop_codon:yes gene_type:complete